MRIKIRHRIKSAEPWKWEIFDDDRSKLVTESATSFATREQAYAAGERILAKMVTDKPDA